MTGSELIEKWIKHQESLGKTRDQIAGNWFIYGNSVFQLKKSGKTKYNLKVQVGCVNLHDFEKSIFKGN